MSIVRVTPMSTDVLLVVDSCLVASEEEPIPHGIYLLRNPGVEDNLDRANGSRC